ncbi:hypothetical protein A7J67_08240 [Achromobacter xylosoxidans]|nr:hypothetical protein A7J67_08240 [Achromobacter xylosoxidans]
MKIFFLAQPIGFYCDEIHGAAIPEGAVEITASKHAELLVGQNSGKLIGADGNGLPVLMDPLPLEPGIPDVISRFQALAALMQAGLLQAVQAWASDSSTDPLHRLAFETATEFSRASPALNAGAEALGWTSEKLDDLFRAGAEILA